MYLLLLWIYQGVHPNHLLSEKVVCVPGRVVVMQARMSEHVHMYNMYDNDTVEQRIITPCGCMPELDACIIKG